MQSRVKDWRIGLPDSLITLDNHSIRDPPKQNLQRGWNILLSKKVAFCNGAVTKKAPIKRKTRFYNGYNFSF